MSDSDAVCVASASTDSYSLPLHIASVFVLLVSSGLGVFTPVIFGARSDRGWWETAFAITKHFGTGTIISLAFCHLLQDSFETFENPCIGELSYEPTAPAIAMGAALLIWLIDFFTARAMSSGSPAPAICAPTNTDEPCCPTSNTAQEGEETPKLKDSYLGTPTGTDLEGGCCAPIKEIEVLDPSSKRAHWDVQLLEAGIVFHSVMIGVSLGAQIDGFATTFAALVFHQLFEGMGLGARIGALTWPKGWRSQVKKWGMCLAYTFVTPIGIAIGIGVHSTFSEDGRSELLAIGILNAISAGILLYGALCQLMYAEWVVGGMRGASRTRVVLSLVSVGLGIFGMSLIGNWT